MEELCKAVIITVYGCYDAVYDKLGLSIAINSFSVDIFISFRKFEVT